MEDKYVAALLERIAELERRLQKAYKRTSVQRGRADLWRKRALRK